MSMRACCCSGTASSVWWNSLAGHDGVAPALVAVCGDVSVADPR